MAENFGVRYIINT